MWLPQHALSILLSKLPMIRRNSTFRVRTTPRKPLKRHSLGNICDLRQTHFQSKLKVQVELLASNGDRTTRQEVAVSHSRIRSSSTLIVLQGKGFCVRWDLMQTTRLAQSQCTRHGPTRRSSKIRRSANACSLRRQGYPSFIIVKPPKKVPRSC